MSGLLRGYGRTDPFQHDAWEWIRPDVWAYLKQERKSGDYSFQGKLKYLNVHFHDTEGLPEDQAAWAYASTELLDELTRCEKLGGATPDAPQKGAISTHLTVLTARAGAKSRWAELLVRAAAELEAKIQAGTLERSGGLVRPVLVSNPDMLAASVAARVSPELAKKVTRSDWKSLTESLFQEQRRIYPAVRSFPEWWTFAKPHLAKIVGEDATDSLKNRFKSNAHGPFLIRCDNEGLKRRGRGGAPPANGGPQSNE